MDNKEKNFVSAVVYLHNDEKYVSEFIDELDTKLKLNFSKYEIIFVNDKSMDSSTKIIKAYAERNPESVISIINMSFHQGLEPCMNAGIDLAIGDFVFEFDSVYIDYDWDILMKVYFESLTGFDIVNASPDRPLKVTSFIFYRLFNKNASLQYKLDTETFRILSRRAINRVRSISKTIPYRKALYANCGLKLSSLKYNTIKERNNKKMIDRNNVAINSLILFTDIAYKITIVMAVSMIGITVVVALYALVYWMFKNPVEGWTTTILFLSFVFFGLFLIMAMVIKYLSVIVNLIFTKKEFLFESVEKL